MSLDAAIIGQLQSLKQANPMMGALPRPGQPNPGVPGMPPMIAPGGFPGMPPPMAPQMAQGLPPPGTNTSLLSVAVNNLPFRYQLNEADLREMCQRWGQLNAVHIYRDGDREVGVMVFADPIDAADCQRQLNGHTCDFQGPGGPAQGSLAAAIGEPMQLSPPRAQMGAPMAGGPMGVPMAGPPPMAALGMAPGQPINFAPQGGQQMMGGMGFQGQPEAASAKGNGKASGGPGWSVKVIVQAERLHPEFQTVLKICGANNMNIDHIRSQGAAAVELRGQRSGTLDARTGQELPEPMYLYMAADTPESGVAALEMVKDLLGSVYDEHQQWCQQNNLQWQHENLQPHVVENPHLMEGF